MKDKLVEEILSKPFVLSERWRPKQLLNVILLLQDVRLLKEEYYLMHLLSLSVCTSCKISTMSLHLCNGTYSLPCVL